MTRRETLQQLHAKWRRSAEVTEARKEALCQVLVPLLNAMGYAYVDVEEVEIRKEGIYVKYTWTTRGCQDWGDVLIPYSVVDAANPIDAVHALHEAREKQQRLAERATDLRELERLQRKLLLP